MAKAFWHSRKHDASRASTAPKMSALAPTPKPENFLARPYKRTRSKSKREKDIARLDFRLERQRLFQEAFHDNIDSKHEIDALTGSEALTVDRGDVLRDPKVKGYQHPALSVKWQPKPKETRRETG
jgi:hypothetical protein